MKKLFLIVLTTLLVSCQTVPKNLKDFTPQKINFNFPFSFEIMTEVDSREFFLKDQETVTTYEMELKDQKLDEQYIRNSLYQTFVAGTEFSSDKKQKVAYLAYDILNNVSDENDDVIFGAMMHGYTLGVLTLLGFPWGSYDYDYKIVFRLYDLDKQLIKEYSYAFVDKVIQGLYYGYGDYSNVVMDKILNDFYSDLKFDEEQIIKYFGY